MNKSKAIQARGGLRGRAIALAVAAFAAFSAAPAVSSAADLKLKKQDIGEIKKLEPVKKIEPKSEPKKLSPKPKKAPEIKPAKASPSEPVKKPKKASIKPGKLKKQATGKLKKLDIKPKGEAPRTLKKATIKSPENINKKLIKPSAKPLAKDLEPARLPQQSPDTDPLKSRAAATRIDPSSDLTKKLVAPSIKDMAIKPRIKENLAKTPGSELQRGGVTGGNLQGLGEGGSVGDTQGGPGEKDLATSRDIVGDKIQQKGGFGRAGVLQGKPPSIFKLCTSGGCQEYTKEDALFDIGSEEDPEDVSDGEVADLLTEAAGEDAVVTVIPGTPAPDVIPVLPGEEKEDGEWKSGFAGLPYYEYNEEDDNQEQGQQQGGEGDASAPDIVPLVEGGEEDGDGEWQSGFAGLPYYEYDDEDESGGGDNQGGGDQGGDNTSGDGSDDEIEYAWEDDETDDAADSSDGSDDASGGNEDGSDSDVDVADEDSGCPEGDENCNNTDTGDEGGDGGRTVDGGPGSEGSSCEEAGGCEGGDPRNQGDDGTVRTAGGQGDEKGGPLKGGTDTSPASGTLRLANEEGVGGELVRGDAELDPADGTLRTPEGEDDDGGGTPQVAGGSGGGSIGNPGVVTEGVASEGGVNVQQNLDLQSGDLKMDTESIENISEQ